MNTEETTGQQETAAPAIELRGISKAFGPVQANKDISINVAKGTIHGIIGENGAGKSTLMSILYGFYKADAGEVFINGIRTEIPDSQAAIAAGIGMVFQHFKLVENFSVLENVVLGAEDGAMLRPSLAKARTRSQRARYYGKSGFTEFMKDIDAKIMFRAHEVMPNGFKTFFDEKLVSVFSATYVTRVQPKIVRLCKDFKIEPLELVTD